MEKASGYTQGGYIGPQTTCTEGTGRVVVDSRLGVVHSKWCRGTLLLVGRGGRGGFHQWRCAFKFRFCMGCLGSQYCSLDGAGECYRKLYCEEIEIDRYSLCQHERPDRLTRKAKSLYSKDLLEFVLQS